MQGRLATQDGKTILESAPAHGIGSAIGVGAHVGGGDDLREGEEGIGWARRLLRKYVQGNAAQFAAVQGLHKGSFDHQFAASGVDQESAILYMR
jgi:hypothetical protein